MFKPAAFFIGLRYTRAKRRNHFISFISLMSMLGIALGIIVLITVLSVMNGFDREIKKHVFSMWPPITVTTLSGNIRNWQFAEKVIRNNPEVLAVAPFVNGQILLTSHGQVQPAVLNGILPDAEKHLSELADKMVAGSIDYLVPGQFGIILGENLADRLGLEVGDKIMVVTPQMSLSPAGVVPRFKRFNVVGVFRAGNGFGFDASLAFIHLQDAQKLFQLPKAVTGLHVNIKNVYIAPEVGEKIGNALGPQAQVMDWTAQFGAFFHAVSLEKNMMFFILMLIIAVAVFNLVCTLVMAVNDKEADIAILRTIGATPKMIMSIFIVQGAVIGLIGTVLGTIGGIALALNVTTIVNWIEAIFHVQFLSSSIYFVNYLPSELQWTDVCHVTLVAFGLSVIATLYPAWRASRTQPVEALRYE